LKITYLKFIGIFGLIALPLVLLLKPANEHVKSQFETQGIALLAETQSGKFGSTTYLKVSIPEYISPVFVLVPKDLPIRNNVMAKLNCKIFESNKIRCSLKGYL
jgi:hypothetical protein